LIETSSLSKGDCDLHLVKVRDLFNAKAKTWDRKYQTGGALAFRVAAFGRLVAQKLSPSAKVLDLGCGTGAIAAAVAAHGFKVTASDVAEEMIRVGKQIHAEATIDWRLLLPDWKELPFAAGTFDAIIASSVLEYLPNVQVVLGECERVLKHGGV